MPQSYLKIQKKIKQLEKLKTSFTKQTAAEKLSILRSLARTQFTGAESLKLYHDLLCFLRAYPDNATVLQLVDNELKSFSKRINYYKKKTSDKKGNNFYNSGIVNSITEHPYSLGAIEYLIDEYKNALTIDWEVNDEVADKLNECIQHLLAYQENDTFDNDDYLDTVEWLEDASGKNKKSVLTNLVNLFRHSSIPRDLQVHFYDNLELAPDWDLTNSKGSRTLKRVGSPKLFYQTEPIKKRSTNLRDELKKTTAKLKHLSKQEGFQRVKDINEVLGVRNRELFPLTYANPEEVYVYEPGRGVQIYLYGAKHNIRLPLETNFGAMIVRNGLPIGYGIAATLFERVEIAINIFPAFRSGESAFIIEQFFKLFYKRFNSRLFLVRSYQMGDGDDEPLKSGALWFYYKLGFRAVKENIRNMIAKEAEVIKSKKNYRSPIEKLRKLAKSDVFLHVDESKMDRYEELSLINLGMVVSNDCAENFESNRELMIEKSIEKLARTLPMKNWKQWDENEQLALKRLAPLFVNVLRQTKWTSKEKRDLVAIIKAKGNRCERKFSLLMSENEKLQNVIYKLSQI